MGLLSQISLPEITIIILVLVLIFSGKRMSSLNKKIDKLKHEKKTSSENS